MGNINLAIFGRSRKKFEKQFPQATFIGYEYGVRWAWYKINQNEKQLIEKICKEKKIIILDIENLGKPFDDARSNGKYKQDSITYSRQPAIKEKTLGKECQISFALNKIVKGNYAIIDINLLQPSHIGNIQNPLHFIPEAQPRNRATSASGHNTPKLIAENLRPAEIVEGATAFAGAPIINERGEVIQGNGRAYTIKYYYSNFPNDPAKYKQWIKDNLTCLGFPVKTSLPKQPVIVRLVNVSDNEAIELGQFTQKDLEAVANETTQIKSKVGLISDATLDTILNNLLAKDTGEQSLSELIRESDILKVLIKENIIRGDDLEVYTRNGVINETGVNFITKLLLNLIFKDGDVNTPDIFLQLPVSLQKSIEKSALYILKCRGEQSINLELAKAVIGLRDYLIFKPNGSIKEWQQQTDIFNNTISDKYSNFELKLISIFADSSSQKQIVDTFKQYAFWATLQPGNMFDDERPALSKKDAVKKVFNIEISDTNDLKLKAIAIAKAKAQALALNGLGNVQNEPIKIIDKEFIKLNLKKDLIQLANHYFLKLPKGVYNYSKAIFILLPKKGFRHAMANGANYYNCVVTKKLNKIVENAMYISTKAKGRKDGKDVIGFYNFINSNVMVNGVRLTIKITIRIIRKGKGSEKYYYDHYEIKKNP